MRSGLKLGAVALGLWAVTFLGMPAAAQHGQDAPPPPQTVSPNASNPTAQSVNEQDLLRELGKLKGRVTIPDRKEAVLQQPQGRTYQTFHERVLPWAGAIVILGMAIALAAFYLVRGPITLDVPQTGVRIKRFNLLERLNHWMTASSFIVLAITGLNYVFGKRLLFPLIGPEAFATWSHWAKLMHNAFPWPFMLGIAVMLVLWVRDNVPDRYDWGWLKQFGGFLSHTHPPAGRFNAGQKLTFWWVALGGLAMIGSGLVMLFPFWAVDINGMQAAQYVHATIGMIFIAVILAHIYIGTFGMRGASEAMVSGDVDLSWAVAHHSIWVKEEQARSADGPRLGRGAVPAE
jgi:formate dehydrogenase subunit gamma